MHPAPNATSTVLTLFTVAVDDDYSMYVQGIYLSEDLAYAAWRRKLVGRFNEEQVLEAEATDSGLADLVNYKIEGHLVEIPNICVVSRGLVQSVKAYQAVRHQRMVVTDLDDSYDTMREWEETISNAASEIVQDAESWLTALGII